MNSIQENQHHTPSIFEDESDLRDSIKNTDPSFSPQDAAGDSVSAVPDTTIRYLADDSGAERGDQLVPIFGVDKVQDTFLLSNILLVSSAFITIESALLL